MDEGTRAAELRARSEELIARASAVLASPRPVYDETMWRAPAREPVRAAPPQPAPKPRPAAPATASRGWVRALFAERQDAMERAVGKLFGAERYRLNMRCTEAERRLAEAEARIARLEREQ